MNLGQEEYTLAAFTKKYALLPLKEKYHTGSEGREHIQPCRLKAVLPDLNIPSSLPYSQQSHHLYSKMCTRQDACKKQLTWFDPHNGRKVDKAGKFIVYIWKKWDSKETDSPQTTRTANTIPPLHLDPTHKKTQYSQPSTSYVTEAKLNINLRRPICNKL